MKRFLVFIYIFFMCQAVYAGVLDNIPKTTLDIARSAEIKNAVKSSEIVRVGIGDNSFNKYYYDSAGIFSTEGMDIVDGDLFLLSVPANKTVNIKLSSDMFVLTYDNGEVIDQVKGPVKFVCKNGFLAVKGLKRVGRQAFYRGEIEITKKKVDKLLNRIKVKYDKYKIKLTNIIFYKNIK